MKLKLDGRDASSEEEVVPIVEDYLRRIIWKEEEEEDIGNVFLYSRFREMGDVEIEVQDIELAARAIRTRKASATDGIIGELIKR